MEMAEGRLISPWMNPGALRRHLVKAGCPPPHLCSRSSVGRAFD